MQRQLTAKLTRKIEDVPRQDWESVFPKVLENYDFFKTLDESCFEQFAFFYIVVYDGLTPIGAATCFTMRFPLDIAVTGPLKLFFGLIKKVLPKAFAPKVVMCGLPMGQGRIGIVGEQCRILEAISDCLERVAQQEKASMIIFKDFNGDYDRMLAPLLGKGFSVVESLPSTDMGIGFANFEDYLKTLSRSSRENLKRNLRKADALAKIDLEIKDRLGEDELAEVYALYLQTYNRQEIGLEKLPMDFFRNISKNMPRQTKYFLWRIEGKIATFALCLVSGEHFIDYYLGFDYAIVNEYYLYFVRFRGLMRWCIACGIKKYEMGVTSYEAKRRMGFDFIRLYFYMRHCNRLFNCFFGIVSPFLKPVNFDPVFKQMRKR